MLCEALYIALKAEGVHRLFARGTNDQKHAP